MFFWSPRPHQSGEFKAENNSQRRTPESVYPAGSGACNATSMLKESISKGMLQFGPGAFKTVGDTSVSLIILDHISYSRTTKKQKHELTPWMARKEGKKEGRGEWGRKRRMGKENGEGRGEWGRKRRMGKENGEGRGEWGRKKKKNNKKLVRFLRLPSAAH